MEMPSIYFSGFRCSEPEPMRSMKLALKRALIIQRTANGSGVTEMFLVNDIKTAIRSIEMGGVIMPTINNEKD